MPQGEIRQRREVNLRVGAAVAEIEGLYAALLRTTQPRQRARLLTELARAGRRLTVLAALPPERLPPTPASGSRRRRRRMLAERGAAWVMDRFTGRGRG
ncbi:hypothetical protein ACFOSC_22175 [Streptantibioticus rubrisoli]|uniref:Uncharacterized protein n=1 Tax=Streptantibioticus rubrisoli TaxID=1387313 RepID=A0ABT1P5P6_9ACTN|nr:hypothetical protein [Streptantibioticus rubrisoli]MCQ4040667.1 hypothetical protein [Streptantibioticus rubrisoli]